MSQLHERFTTEPVGRGGGPVVASDAKPSPYREPPLSSPRLAPELRRMAPLVKLANGALQRVGKDCGSNIAKRIK